MLLRVRSFVIAFSMVLALAPFSGIAVAALLASAVGCEINDAAAEPCHAFGMNFYPLLSDLLMTANLGEIAFSILSVLLVVWGGTEGIALVSRLWQRRSRRAAT